MAVPKRRPSLSHATELLNLQHAVRAEIVPFPRYFLPRKAVIRRLRDAHWRRGSQARLEYEATGLPAWKRGQSGQVGNEAAPTVATSAGVRLVNLIP